MKTKQIELIKKNTNDESIEQCDLCCLDGICLSTDARCLKGEYFVLSNKRIKLVKYECKIIEDTSQDDAGDVSKV